jgi:NADPH2 dehydrogenase
MPETGNILRIPTLKSVEDFRRHVDRLGLALPCDDQVLVGPASPLAQPLTRVAINGKRIGNRYAIQPMEGWDGLISGDLSPEVMRRWQRFGESGAKIVMGGEAMAVRPDGRSNPRQLMLTSDQRQNLARLRTILVEAHQRGFGQTNDLVVGFQLTHSGRFSKPHDFFRPEPRAAFRHPLLDSRCDLSSDAQLFTDAELDQLVDDYARAAKVAAEAGADFVDLKHCHGYLLHELLGAHTRPGKYGGSFENRTRMLRAIVAAIRASGNPIDIAVRLSAFDWVPFQPDPARSQPGKPGPGVPVDYRHCLPYDYGFGVKAECPVEYDLTETFKFMELCSALGIKILNLSAGSPYYNPHIQRPAAYPPSDGYQPPYDPLVDVARQIDVVRQLKCRAPSNLILVGSAYSYLQEYLPQVAQGVLRQDWVDVVGIGRAVLSYPRMLADALDKGTMETRRICRTFSDCTTAPRQGLISGCYPLDKYYTAKPEFQRLKELKKAPAPQKSFEN